jgi:hypothetical protein
MILTINKITGREISPFNFSIAFHRSSLLIFIIFEMKLSGDNNG